MISLFFKTFLFFFFSFSLVAPTYAHDHNHSHTDNNDREMALKLFELAYLLSPDFLPKRHRLTPGYQLGQEKLLLNQSSIILMREWIHILTDEIEKNCEGCQIEKEKLLQLAINQELEKEANNSIPKNQLLQKSKNKSISIVEHTSSATVHYTAKHGKVVAGLIVSLEVFETIASLFLGLKGIHFLCTPIQILTIPAGRFVQRYGQALFGYGFHLNNSSILLASKMAWTNTIIKNRAKNTFFYIDQALEFNQEELERVNTEGPHSLFKSKGHRLLWMERLKKKTDPLFEKITHLEQELEKTNLTQTQKNKIEDQIQNTQEKIEKLSQINRKEFFGDRFKRYLFLTSRKRRAGYMDGQDLKFFNFIHKTLGGRNMSWSLAPQFMMEQTLETKEAYKQDTLLGNASTPTYQQADEVISGLVDEFLSQSNRPDATDRDREAVHFFLSDFHNLFNTSQTYASREMSAEALEALLINFFTSYLDLQEKRATHSIRYMKRMRIYKKIGTIKNRLLQFTDFLYIVAASKNPNKINFYKYESIEKFFSFLLYFYQLNHVLNQNLSIEETLAQIEKAQKQVESFSLTRNKNSQIQWIPFKKRRGKCYEITKKRL